MAMGDFDAYVQGKQEEAEELQAYAEYKYAMRDLSPLDFTAWQEKRELENL